MSTLVVCVDRTDDVGRKTGIETPVVGWEAVHSLVTEMGLSDPEDSAVNSLLEALRIARDLRDTDEQAIVAVVSGASDSVVGADRAVATQLDELIDHHDPDSAVVVIDSAQDERLVPIVESRLPVDAVDRVVVRQAHNLESTYYLLKQFLADEELRQTVLVPIGITLLVFPLLQAIAGFGAAMATIAAVIGGFLLYKGFGVDDHVSDLPAQARDMLYSGQVSVVTYAVAGGLGLVGLFAGAIGLSTVPTEEGSFIAVMGFVYDSVPWLAAAALVASTGRLLDDTIRNEEVRNAYVNLPFGVVGVGMVVRGFSGYFLEQATLIESLSIPAIRIGVVSVDAFPLPPVYRLAAFGIAGIAVSLIGVRIASYVGGTTFGEGQIAD